MVLSIIRDGKRFPYSEAELRKDNPNVSFPKGLAGVDFSAYGVIAEKTVHAAQPVQPIHHSQSTVAAQCFLWALRDAGMHVHFERYRLACVGYTRDYWNVVAYISKSSSHVAHFRAHFGLSDHDFNAIWYAAENYEE